MNTTSSPNEAPSHEAEGGVAPEAAVADAAPAVNAAAPPDSALARIVALESEVAQLKDQALRALAEAENTRRRAEREIIEKSRFAIANFARELLPVADNLHRALDSVTAEARQGDERLAKLYAGIELTARELATAFERSGIRRIDPLGQPFDHNYHQAVFQLETGDHPPGTVAQVLQAGFVLNDRLLRPAMVGVAKASASAAGGDAANGQPTRVDTRA